jgi:hypothetical protein
LSANPPGIAVSKGMQGQLLIAAFLRRISTLFQKTGIFIPEKITSEFAMLKTFVTIRNGNASARSKSRHILQT